MQKNYTKKVLMTQITTMVWSLAQSWHHGVLDPHEVKWVLGSITTNKASGGDEIPAELFKILKDDAIKDDDATLNIPANLENSAVATGLEKVSFHCNPKFTHYFWQLIFSLQLLWYSNDDFLFLYFYKDFPKDYLFIPFPVCVFLILHIHIYALMISA